MIFLFPQKVILFFRHKGKDDLFQKNAWIYDIFFRCSEKMAFPKNSRLNIFFVTSGKTVFLFSRKCDIFSLGGKWKKMIFIKKRMEIYFLYICEGVTGVTLPASGKNAKMPQKYTPKGDISSITEKNDIHPRFILFLLKYHIHWHPRNGPISTHRKCSTRKGVIRYFAKFTGKDLCHRFVFDKATDLRAATSLGLQLY